MSLALGHALAGVVGGVVSTTATYPLLVTTNRLQAARRSASKVEGYENALQAFKSILREGPSGFFSGYESALIGTAYANAVYYYLYQFLNELVSNLTLHKPLHLIDNIVVASLSGAATAVASNPIWVINTRASVNAKNGQNKSIMTTAIEIIQKEGISSLWSGVLPALILVLNPVINYVLFERLQLWISKKGKKLNPGQLFVLGAFTKLVAAFITHPYLVIKTRLQVGGEGTQHGTWQTLLKMIREEGLAGLFSGLSTKLVHSVLTSALLFLIKDQTTTGSIQFLMLLGLIKSPRRGSTPH